MPKKKRIALPQPPPALDKEAAEARLRAWEESRAAKPRMGMNPAYARAEIPYTRPRRKPRGQR